jgi:putative Holliday junction resolvase
MGGSADKAGRPQTLLSVGITVGHGCRRMCEPAVSFVAVAQLRPMVRRGTRLLGLDIGTKRIGLAVSDVTWSVATPVRTLQRTRLARDLEAIRALAAELEVGGRVGPRCQSVRQFARDLGAVLRLPTAFWDERLSTAAVDRFLIGEADLSRRRRRRVVDRAAAAWILQGALDALRHSGSVGGQAEGAP